MVDQRLVEYVRTALAQGYSEQDIRQQFLSSGYPAQTVDAVFRAVHPNHLRYWYIGIFVFVLLATCALIAVLFIHYRPSAVVADVSGGVTAVGVQITPDVCLVGYNLSLQIGADAVQLRAHMLGYQVFVDNVQLLYIIPADPVNGTVKSAVSRYGVPYEILDEQSIVTNTSAPLLIGQAVGYTGPLNFSGIVDSLQTTPCAPQAPRSAPATQQCTSFECIAVLASTCTPGYYIDHVNATQPLNASIAVLHSIEGLDGDLCTVQFSTLSYKRELPAEVDPITQYHLSVHEYYLSQAEGTCLLFPSEAQQLFATQLANFSQLPSDRCSGTMFLQ